jgi:hypothetical protein
MDSLGLVLGVLGFSVALCAAAAAVWSAVTAAQSRRESRATRLEFERQEALRAARRVDVYWGHDRMQPGHSDSFVVIVNNRGDQAIYDLRVNAFALPEQRYLVAEIVPPGWWRSRFVPRDPAVPLGFGYMKPVDPARFSLAGDKGHYVEDFEFSDGDGTKWRWTRESGMVRS